MPAARVLRFDFAAGEPLAAPTQLPNGSWVLEGYATRAGVFPYQNADGSMRYELRHPDEVGPTAAGLAKCALTDDHPKEGLVTPANASALMRGLVLESQWDEASGRVPVKVLVTHQDLLESLAAGKKELSCGYQCESVPEEGEYRGEKYTHRQRGILYNHLAVVDAGRAGPECALRLDSAGNVVSRVDTEAPPASDVSPIPYPEPPPLPGGNKEQSVEKEIVVNGTKFMVPAALAEAYMAQQAMWEKKLGEVEGAAGAKMEIMAKDMTAKETQLQATSAKLDSVNGEVVKLKQLHADAVDPAKVNERITARLELERLVRPVLGANYEYPKAAEETLKMDALEKLLPKDSPIRGKLQAAMAAGNFAYLGGLFEAEISRSGRADGGDDTIPAPAAKVVMSLNDRIIAQQKKQKA